MPEPEASTVAEIRVCMPIYRAVEAQTFASVWRLSQSRVCLDIQACTDVATARNGLIERLQGEPYLLFVDSDMVFTSQQIEEMYWILKQNPQMGALAALACTARGSAVPNVNWSVNGEWLGEEDRRARALEFTQNNVVAPVDMFGTGVCLIDTKVFAKIPKPWFEFDREKMWGEDTYFTQKLITAGYTPCTHFGITVGHVGPTLWMPEGAKDLELDMETPDVEKEGMAQIAV